MQFSVVHLAEVPSEGEEVFIVVPGGPRTAIGVPLDALPQFFPLLAEATAKLPPPRCPACSALLPAGIEDSQEDT